MPILLQCSSFGSFQRAVPRLRAPWGERPAGHPEEHRSDAGQAQPGGNSCCNGALGSGTAPAPCPPGSQRHLQTRRAMHNAELRVPRSASFFIVLPGPRKYSIDGAPMLSACSHALKHSCGRRYSHTQAKWRAGMAAEQRGWVSGNWVSRPRFFTFWGLRTEGAAVKGEVG